MSAGDNDAAEVRRRTMQAVKNKDTTPELIVRRLLHSLGYRYRLHVKDLPGKPDLVFPARRKVIFVHGCFWHGHDCQRGARIPKTNTAYWVEKVARNKRRDQDEIARLTDLRWQVLTVWECEMKNIEGLKQRLTSFL
jgi:DNA mismatch endonuclease, patch repair protein